MLNECSKVHIFWEGHKILWNLHLTFVLCSASQKKVKISQNFVAFSEYMNFTTAWTVNHAEKSIDPWKCALKTVSSTVHHVPNNYSKYRRVAGSNLSYLEPHPGFYNWSWSKEFLIEINRGRGLSASCHLLYYKLPYYEGDFWIGNTRYSRKDLRR